MLARLTPLLVLTALLAPGCAGDASSGTVRVTGRVVDAETGEPIERSHMYVHAFNDATGHQVSLKPTGSSEFELEMPDPEIRLRVPDLSDEYELYEERFVAEDGALDVTVRMQPTHWVRLHGTVLWRDADGTLRPTSEGDGNVRKARLSAGPVGFDTEDDGTYSVRAPRESLKILSINTNYHHTPRVLDLSDVTADDYEFHIVLTPNR